VAALFGSVEVAAAQPAVKKPAVKKPAVKKPAVKKPAVKRPVAKRPVAKKKLPDPVLLGGNDLVTSDGMQLAGTYYPGTEGKKTVPVVLLHMFKGSRKDFGGLAKYLQEQGHAVVALDLRGHGQSTRALGSARRLQAAKMAPNQFYAMPYYDLPCLWDFLKRKNDEGELNLSSLCLVGAEMGAGVAGYFALHDWTRQPPRETRMLRPVPDVKAMVLISPNWDFPRLSWAALLKAANVLGPIPTAILVGKEDRKAWEASDKVYKKLTPFHTTEGDPANRNLIFGQLPTKLQGTQILGLDFRGLPPEEFIARFIEHQVVGQNYPWRARSASPARKP
jgi:pimeloyl-ACP methyl ester carboxylesterase